jgi:hypothetical protein
MPNEPTKLDPNAVDAELTPGLRIPDEHSMEEVEENTKDGEVTATVYTFKQLATIESATWRPGNPEREGAAYGEEQFRLRFKITDPDSPNFGRFVDDQFMRFYMGLITRSWEDLRAIKDTTEKGQFERRLGALKYETVNNMRFMKKFLKALGFEDRLSAARKNFIDFTTILDLLENKGEQLRGVEVMIEIEKGRPDYGGTPREKVIGIEEV